MMSAVCFKIINNLEVGNGIDKIRLTLSHNQSLEI